MKRSKKDFEVFKKTFQKYQDLFGLSGYSVFFRHEKLEGNIFGSINISLCDMTAAVSFNTELDEHLYAERDVKSTAKHEALHLLTGRIDQLAKNRHSTEAEIYAASEELVNKLMGLIP